MGLRHASRHALIQILPQRLKSPVCELQSQLFRNWVSPDVALCSDFHESLSSRPKGRDQFFQEACHPDRSGGTCFGWGSASSAALSKSAYLPSCLRRSPPHTPKPRQALSPSTPNFPFPILEPPPPNSNLSVDLAQHRPHHGLEGLQTKNDLMELSPLFSRFCL